MTPATEELLEPLWGEVADMNGAEAVAALCRMGLVSRRAAERLYARFEVERLVRGGEGRCRAVERVADRLCCSYEKVRGFVYDRSPQ